MKKILITGINSYVGTSLEKWLKNYPKKFSIDKISLRDDKWMEKDFSDYDVIFHVAGIAHVSSDPKMEETYYKVNCDLTIQTAKKAKAEGVMQFIFMSSIIVYGDSKRKRVINKKTSPSPRNFYGNSKLMAESGLKLLEDENFKVVIVRPPMIYGQGSKGNYPKLAKVASKLPIFPDIENQRSMLYIDNLCEFIRLMVENEESGLFFPQNREYVKTSEMVKLIADVYGKEIKLTKVFNPFLKFFKLRVKIIDKIFGDLVYEKSMSIYKDNYQIVDLHDSIKLTEGRK